MIGSAARRSCHTNADSSTSPAAARPAIVAEPHAYSSPPHVVTRISALTPGQQRGAQPVDRVALRGRPQVQAQDDDEHAIAPIGMFT